MPDGDPTIYSQLVAIGPLPTAPVDETNERVNPARDDGDLRARLTSILAQLDVPLSTRAAEGGNLVTIISNTGHLPAIDANIGAQADSVATSDTGTFSVIAFIKRLLDKLQSWIGEPGIPTAKVQTIQGIAGATAVIVSGFATDGTPPVNPGVAISGFDGTNKRRILTDASGRLLTVSNKDTASYTISVTGPQTTAPFTLGAADKFFGIEIHRPSGNATWTVSLQVSLDGSNWTTIISNVQQATAGQISWNVNPSPALYIRANITALTLGTSQNIVINIVGAQ